MVFELINRTRLAYECMDTTDSAISESDTLQDSSV